jgi:hypothetical protein
LHRRSPRTPNRQHSSGFNSSPMSPISPGQIIYEYREVDD